MSLDDLESILEKVSLKYRCDDRKFIEHIYVFIT